MEAELVALESATTEAEWLKELLMDLPMVDKPVPAILLHCDKQIMITNCRCRQCKGKCKVLRTCEMTYQISKAFEKY
jgi:hypothetical protein